MELGYELIIRYENDWYHSFIINQGAKYEKNIISIITGTVFLCYLCHAASSYSLKILIELRSLSQSKTRRYQNFSVRSFYNPG